MTYTDEVHLEVIKNRHDCKVWKITHNSRDPESVGEITSCGVPCNAKDLPIGTKAKMVTSIEVPDTDPRSSTG